MTDTASMIPLDEIGTSGVSDPSTVKSMADTARTFLELHQWCRSIVKGYFDRGIPGVVAIFFFEIVPAEADSEVWVIVGDVPPAYIDVDPDASSEGCGALEVYIACMRDWCEAVLDNRSVEDLMPVGYQDTGRPLRPTHKLAVSLNERLDFLEQKVLPFLRENRWE